MGQVFFSEAGVALDASRGISSPSSTYEMGKIKTKKKTLGLAHVLTM